MKTIFHAQRVSWSMYIEVSIGRKDEDGLSLHAGHLTFTPLADMEAITEPTMKLRIGEAQALMDELWNAGLRPSEGTGSAGSLAATERHLKDMQTITMGLLEGKF